MLKLGAGLAQGFLALLGEKVKFVNRLMADEVRNIRPVKINPVEYSSLKLKINSLKNETNMTW